MHETEPADIGFPTTGSTPHERYPTSGLRAGLGEQSVTVLPDLVHALQAGYGRCMVDKSIRERLVVALEEADRVEAEIDLRERQKDRDESIRLAERLESRAS